MVLYSGFVGAGYESQAVTADQERTVNWYIERMESPGATCAAALYPTPGVTQLALAPTGPGRAHFFQREREFAVIGATFFEIASNGTLTNRGTVLSGADPATISSNGDGGGQLFITSGGNGYTYNLATNVLTQVVALNGIATMGDAVDGYFLALNSATSTLRISNLLDGLTWDPTQFAQRSIASDPWRSVKVSGRYIWLLGDETSEVWYNAGSSPFPFAPHPSGLIQHGIAAKFSPTIMDGSIVWLAASRDSRAYVVKAAGFTPEVISDFPTQFAFGGYTTLSDAIGDSYNDLGHTFYLLTFPTAATTWSYDAQSGLWAERLTWISELNVYVAWRPRWHALAFGQHRMLDANGGEIYRMSHTLSTDVGGRVIRRLRRAPTLMAENERVFYAAFELDLEPGLGIAVGQGVDPQVMMRYSDDGGKSWSSERLAGAGKIGEYFRRVRWNRCGMGRRRVFEVSVTDPIPWRLTNAYLTLGQPLRAAANQGRQQVAR